MRSTRRQLGINVVVVHGGGPQIAAMLKRMDVQSEFIEVGSPACLLYCKYYEYIKLMHVYLCGRGVACVAATQPTPTDTPTYPNPTRACA